MSAHTPLWNELWRFILLREDLRTNPASITRGDDPILFDHRFCNINREHDAVTRWVKQHVRDLTHWQDNCRHQVANISIARLWNNPDTLAEFGLCDDYIDLARVQDVIEERASRGDKVWRGAYMMPVHNGDGKTTSTQYFIGAVGKVWMLDFDRDTSLEAIAAKLTRIRGLGDFLANQIVTDLRYSPGVPSWDDWETFVLCGPGTRRGLRRYYGHPVADDRKMDYSAMIIKLRGDILDELLTWHNGAAHRDSLLEAFRDPNNLSNTFCEFDKWLRGHAQVRAGETVTLRKYQPSPTKPTNHEP